MLKLSDLQNKNIAILGFGLEGRATADYFLQNGINATICDKIDIEEFTSKYPAYLEIKKYLGSEYLTNLTEFDYVFKTPGISPLIPEIVSAENSGVIFSSQIELFFNVSPTQNVIGVTGTKGKGTTSTLIYEMLKAPGKDVYLGGNIGTPAIGFIDKLTTDSWVVLELSSFQLQTLKTSPHMAVVLNITSEHLDYHKDTSEYRQSKANIVKFQKSKDIAIFNSDYDVPMSFAKQTGAKKYYFSRYGATNGAFVDEDDYVCIVVNDSPQRLFRAEELLLRGRHNLENVTAAATAAFCAGVNPNIIAKVAKNFVGLEHRLELVTEINGVKYYNDSFSTVPETAIAAVDSFNQPIVLIAGGSSKNSDYTALGKKISSSNIRAVILIGNTAVQIKAAIPSHTKLTVIEGLTTMSEIVEAANEAAKPGDVVLLSPASASFGLFENYKDRGNQFKEEVRGLSLSQ